MRRLGWIIGIVGIGGLIYFLPPFHIVSLKSAEDQKAEATFNPKKFAEQFWSERLLPSLSQAVPAEVLLPAISRDPASARQRYARSLGISDSYTYFLSGEGRVVDISDGEISLGVTSIPPRPQIVIETGLLFGNALRDGTDLLDVSDYPNSQDFNGISEALNHIVETRVLPDLREHAKVGSTVRFVGCAEVNDAASGLHPLRVVPIVAEVR